MLIPTEHLRIVIASRSGETTTLCKEQYIVPINPSTHQPRSSFKFLEITLDVQNPAAVAHGLAAPFNGLTCAADVR